MAHASVFVPRPPAARSSALSARVVAVLCGLVVVFGALFVLAPGPVASSTSGVELSDQGTLSATVKSAFIGYWNSGSRTFTPDMARVVDYWRQYHVVKAVAAALLLVVAATFAVRLWRALSAAGPRGAGARFGLTSAWAAATLLVIGAVLLLMANVQGSIAPLSSAIGLLPFHTRDGALTAIFDQIRHDLTGYSRAGAQHPPIVARLVGDFAAYHAVIAVLTGIEVVFTIAMSVALWRRFRAVGKKGAPDERRTRRLLATLGTLFAVMTAAALVVFVANTGTTADPAPTLLGFFEGGW